MTPASEAVPTTADASVGVAHSPQSKTSAPLTSRPDIRDLCIVSEAVLASLPTQILDMDGTARLMDRPNR